jgi:hypothetical protein
VVRRIDVLFEIERSINGKNAEERLEMRQTLIRPLVENLLAYMRDKRWASFTLFLRDGRVFPPIMLLNEACEASLWDENPGCCAARIAVDGGQRPCPA